MPENQQVIYLITPRMSGFANDLLVQTEDKKILYHVRSKLFAPMGQVYTIEDDNMQELYITKEDHTIVFPCHAVFQKNNLVAKVGQLGFLPQNYCIELEKGPKMAIKIPVFGGIFRLEGPQGIVAEIAQHRANWIVAINTNSNYTLILAMLAIVYREYSIGG